MAQETEQSQYRGLDTAWNAVISMASGTAVYGLLGWFADKWLNTGHVLFVVGIVGGNMLSLYALAKRFEHADAQALAAKRAGRASG
jgi:F0F1-type ATP synthase assembly protein I